MYYQFDSRLNMPAILFDDDRIIVGGKEYDYSELTDIEIAKTPLLAAYGIVELRTDGRSIPVPFARADIHRLRMAVREAKHIIDTYIEDDHSSSAASKETAQTASDTDLQEVPGGREKNPEAVPTDRAPLDPYEEMKKLKELLDLDIITEEEFARKKKELLGL